MMRAERSVDSRQPSRLIRQNLPDTQIVLLGQYARHMAKHAAQVCAADFVASKPADLSNEPAAFDLYAEKRPPFVALQLNPSVAVPEVEDAVKKGVLHFTFFEEDVCQDNGQPLLETFAKTKGLHKHLRYHLICGLDPAKITPDIAGVLADEHVAVAHFEEAEAGSELALLKLIDCLGADHEKRTVQKKMRKVRKLCSTEEYVPPRWAGFRPAPDEKIEYCFGLPPDELRKKLKAVQSRARAARESLFDTDAFPRARRDLDLVDHDILVGEHSGRRCRVP